MGQGVSGCVTLQPNRGIQHSKQSSSWAQSYKVKLQDMQQARSLIGRYQTQGQGGRVGQDSIAELGEAQ